MHVWAISALYRRVILPTPVKISLFARTMRSSNVCAGKPASVRALCIAGFGDRLSARSARNICAILHAVAPSLQRLLVSLPLRLIFPSQPNNERTKRQPLRHALESLSPRHLIEFLSVRDELFLGQYGEGPVVWPSWTGLRRFALYNPVIDDVFLSALANLPLLEVVAFINADSGDLGLTPAPILPSLRRVLFVFRVNGQWDEDNFGEWGLYFRSIGVKRGAPVEVARVICPEQADWFDWMNHQIVSGEWWEMGNSTEQPSSPKLN